MGVHTFLEALTIVLCTAGVTTVLFQRLRQPVVLGYVLAGFIVGPHVPIPLVADREAVQTLSELGVILLMFSLGLEFSLKRLLQVGPTAGLTAVIESSIMYWLGFVVAKAFGWTTRESLFTGAILAISSTTIIAKAFEEKGVRGKLRELVVGVLIVEDLIAILLMAVLTATAAGNGLSAGTLLQSSGRLIAFLIALLAAGMLVVPRLIRTVNRLKRPETSLVVSIGLCFAFALLAREFGYSVALGAFIAGSLIAESGEEKRIERLVQPVRDMFAAVFFVSVGMLIEPSLMAKHGWAVAILATTVIAGKMVGVSAGAFLTGHGTRTSVQAGMSLAQIGEFSFIIAALGISLRATGDFLYPVAVAVSALTTLTTPLLMRASGPTATFVDRKLPRPLQTFAALYGSWVEQLRNAPRPKTAGAIVRRLVKLLALDTVLLAGLAIGSALTAGTLTEITSRRLHLGTTLSRTLVILPVIAIAIPFCVGIVKTARRLGVVLAEAALPETGEGMVDLAAAPRRALVVTLQLAVVLLVGLPLLALTQPFFPGLPVALVMAGLLVILGFGFWRSATNLQGHVRAGAQVIVEALAQQAQKGATAPSEQALADVKPLLPGLGEPVPVRLQATSNAVGKTLAELNVRGLTGATVLAIARCEAGLIIPTAGEILRAGDILALAGTYEAVEAARALLEPRVDSAYDKP